jgi:Tol biopolymer transport system component
MKPRAIALLAALLVLLGGCGGSSVDRKAPPRPNMVFVVGDATQENAPSISSDGRLVAFSTGFYLNVYDVRARRVDRITLHLPDHPGDAQPRDVTISGNGRFIAFTSFATTITSMKNPPCFNPDNSDHCQDVFVYDRETGEAHLMSEGKENRGRSAGPAISADGRFVAFTSLENGLLLRDRDADADGDFDEPGTSKTIAVGSQARAPALSADGRFVAYVSRWAPELGMDPAPAAQVFVFDRIERKTVIASVMPSGEPGPEDSGSPSLSADGRKVAFTSSSNPAGKDRHFQTDIFVRDLVSGSTRLVSVGSPELESRFGPTQGNSGSERPIMTADGRFVVFTSELTLAAEDAGSDCRAAGGGESFPDIYRSELATERVELVSANEKGTCGNGFSGAATVSGDGSVVAFSSHADLTSDAPGQGPNVYVRFYP